MADTYNPIIGREEIKGWRVFGKRPVPDAQTALVISGEGQPLLTIKQGQRGITNGEMMWGKYNFFYRVDLTEHRLSFRHDLPSKIEAFVFHAEVTFMCSVNDPATIVQRNVTDVRQVLEPLIIEVMRAESRNYDTEKSGIAEREIGNSIKQAIYDAGFQVHRFVLQLSRDEEVKQIERDDEIERIKEENKIKLMRMKMDFYGPMIQAGNWQMLAMQLAQNPEDVQFIVQQLNQQKQLERQHQVEMLKMLLNEDALESSQISEVAKVALQNLLGVAEQSIPELKGSSDQSTEVQDSVIDVDLKDSDASNDKKPNFNWDEDEED